MAAYATGVVRLTTSPIRLSNTASYPTNRQSNVAFGSGFMVLPERETRPKPAAAKTSGQLWPRRSA